MVKHQKERLYPTSREVRLSQQQRSGSTSIHGGSNRGGVTRSLPFDCCALTLNPYTHPVCSRNGVLFENSAILPYLLKHKKDPVTGNPMTSKDLITLHMDKDDDGKWQCPVLLKPFTEHSKIVAIRQNPPGNEAYVYSYDAVEELNLKPKNFEDLTTGKPFHRIDDMIILQDPTSPNSELCKLRDINNFKHLSTLRDENQTKQSLSTENTYVRHSVTSSRIMEQLQNIKRTRQEKEENEKEHKNKQQRSTPMQEKEIPNQISTIYIDELVGVQYTTGKASGSFTSTAVPVSYDNTMREATEEEVRISLFHAMKQLKKKCHIRLLTNFGNIDLELHCDIAPRTCTNFIGLVETGKYNGTLFHRLIKNFMIQGGKPTTKEEKETSYWGDPFPDEFDDRLKHCEPGVVSMANAGSGTNLRQCFITFKSTPHLDRKHSVFGRVIAGMEVLYAIEKIPTDEQDRPSQDVKIIEATIIGVNPVKEAEQKERLRIEQRKREKQIRVDSQRNKSVDIVPSVTTTTTSSLDLHDPIPVQIQSSKNTTTLSLAQSRLPPPPIKTEYKDFSGW